MAGLAAAHEVVAVDLPGFGGSAMLPEGTRPGVAELADSLTAFCREQGAERPHVVGNSLGGAIALELARRGFAASADP